MEHVTIFSGYEDKMGGFDSLQTRVNEWLAEPAFEKYEVVDRAINLTQRSTMTQMVISIFYREKK